MLMEANQKTILKEGRISGTGLHSGKICEVFFKPGAAGTGIHFFKAGRSIGVVGSGDTAFSHEGVARCSAIGSGDLRVLTVEHLLAAIYGLGISNLAVDVHGEEIPGVDGSALPFVELFRKLGIADQKEKRAAYRVSEPIFCHENGKAISIYPSERFEVSYCLDYDYPGLRNQKAEYTISSEIFESQIAPCRTFCTQDEARELKQRGFGLGGTPENNIIVSPDGSHEKGLRFPDECVRHKILDVVGDLSLLGFPVLGKVIGIRSGHSLNRKLVQEIRRQKEAMENKKEGKKKDFLMDIE